MTESIALNTIRIDGGTQPRVSISEEKTKDYAEYMRSGALMPDVDVFYDGAEYWLADGFHRYFACKSLGRPFVTATIHTGTRREAVLFSVGANHSHGLPRTNADKRKAAMTLLQDEEWSHWSNVEIAKRCGIGETLVRDVRSSLPEKRSETAPRTYTTKHGTESTMKVGRIGKSKTLPDKSKAAQTDRRDVMRKMAAEGYTSQQMAAKLELSETGCRRILREEGIVVSADLAMGITRRPEANRIVERMVMDAENLTADVNLIEFSALDRDRLGEWADSLIASKKALDAFIRRLIKEQQKHGEAA